MWPDTMRSMGISKHIKFEYKGETWKNFMINLCMINGIEGKKVLTIPITPHNKLRELYLNYDIGLFPNRCEGGTNLVLMEYMACGKPVIASYNSGHKDILTEHNSLQLKQMHEFKLYDNNKKLIADWEEPDLDEIIAKLEYAYFNRDNIRQIGKNAAQAMKQFSWKQSADSLLKYFKL
jgi:glycosyltransferase involved in cell wall biosynthesis